MQMTTSMKTIARAATGLSMILAMQAASATMITYDYLGNVFGSNINGTYVATDRIVGSISFDSSVLNAAGTGQINVTNPAQIPSLTWGFTDGHITYNNTITTTNYRMYFNFNASTITNWEIDATFGGTNPDLWSIGNLTSVHEEGRDTHGAGSVNGSGAQIWSLRQTQQVPEPASLVLIGLGLAGLGFARRKKA